RPRSAHSRTPRHGGIKGREAIDARLSPEENSRSGCRRSTGRGWFSRQARATICRGAVASHRPLRSTTVHSSTESSRDFISAKNLQNRSPKDCIRDFISAKNTKITSCLYISIPANKGYPWREDSHPDNSCLYTALQNHPGIS